MSKENKGKQHSNGSVPDKQRKAPNGHSHSNTKLTFSNSLGIRQPLSQDQHDHQHHHHNQQQPSYPPPTAQQLSLSLNSNHNFHFQPNQPQPAVESPYYPQRFLPKQLVMGSPFYQTSDPSFVSHVYSPLNEHFSAVMTSSPNYLRSYSHSQLNLMRMNSTHSSNPASRHNSGSHPNSTSSSNSNSKLNLSSKLIAENNKHSDTEKSLNEDSVDNATNRDVDEETNITENDTTIPLPDSLPAQLDDSPSKSTVEGNGNKSAINTRSLKLSKLRSDISLTDILELITLGPIETCHYDLNDDPSTNLPAFSSSSPSPPSTYRSVIISFMDSFTANECYIQLTDILGEMRHLLNSPKLVLSSVDSLPLSDYIQSEINNNGASRAICLSNLPYNLSEKILLTELSKFGTLQSVEYNVDKNAAFVYFTSIFNAIKCFDQLPLSNSILSNSKIFYSNDGSSVNIPTFSASNSFLDTFADNNEIGLFKETNANNLISYSRTSTSVSSPRISTDFTTCTNDSNGGPSYKENGNSDNIGSNSNNRTGHNDIRQNINGNLHDSSSVNDGIDQTGIQNGTDPTGADADGDVEGDIANNLTSSTILNNSGFFQESYTPVVLHEYMHQPYGAHQLYDTPPVYRVNENPSVTSLLQNNIGNRTVYLGGLPGGTTHEDVCNKIRGGILENIKFLPDRKVAFITFVYHQDAANFIARTFKENLFINSKCIKVGWGRNSGNLNPEIQLAVDYGACRNLYIGVNEELEKEGDYEMVPVEVSDEKKDKAVTKLQSTNSNESNNASDEASEVTSTRGEEGSSNLKKIYHAIPDEDTLRRDFSIFGEIEQINFFKNGSCAFINFTNILSCIKAVEDFQSEDNSELQDSFDNRYQKFRIAYGKDRCGNPPKKKRTKKSNNNRSRANTANTNTSQFNYALDSNQSIDTDLALKFDTAFTGIGISSPSATKKVKHYKNLSDKTNVVVSDIEYDSISDTEKEKVDTYNAEDTVITDIAIEQDTKADEGESLNPDLIEDNAIPEIEEEDEEDEEEDEEVDIVTETLNTSYNSSAGDSKMTNGSRERNPRTSRSNSKSNRSRLYSSSRSSSMTSFHNHPYNSSNNYSFSYNQDNYANEAPGYILTPQSYYYPSQNSNSSQFPVSVPHTPMRSYSMNYYLTQGGPPPSAYYYYSAPQQQSQQQSSTPLLHQQHPSYPKTKNTYKRYQKNKQQPQNRNFTRTGVSGSKDSSQEFTYDIESSTPNCKK